MNAKKAKRLSRKLSYLLRHGAIEAGVAMDAAGWVDVDAVLAWAKIERAWLDHVVATNDKSRLQMAGGRIRASQGHSRGGVPVTVAALEASWEPVVGRVEPLIHGTRASLVPTIRAQGLKPMDRTHVHLADGAHSRVGKRAGVAVLVQVAPLELAAQGIDLYRSPNGVYLCREVPPSALCGVISARPAAPRERPPREGRGGSRSPN